MQWAYKLQVELELFAESRVYTNFLGVEGEVQIRSSYGTNFERLVALKNI